MERNLAFRLLVAAGGIPLLLFIAAKGGLWLLVLCMILAGGCGSEIVRLIGRNRFDFGQIWGTFTAFLAPVFCYFDLSFQLYFAIVIIGVGAIIALENRIESLSDRLLAGILPAIYPGILISFLVLLSRRGTGGSHLVVFSFLLVWAVDTAAYFGGRAFGRKKLSPVLSPNKTWAGFFAGFAGAIVAAMVSRLVFLHLPIAKLALLAVIGALAAQAGDLFESGLKRAYGAKDSSAVLPGHGGLLDRFDSLLFAAPVIYYLTTLWP